MITPFNPSVIARAVEVVARSGADRELLTLLSPRGSGRRPSYNTTAFLVGAILAVQWKGSLVIRDIHRVLTQRLPIDVQRELGVRRTAKDAERHMTEKDLYAITEAIGIYLDYGQGSAPDLDRAQRTKRRAALLDLMHRLLQVTLPASPTTSRAVDGTGIWSYGKAARRAPSDLLVRDANGEPLVDEEEPGEPSGFAALDAGASEPTEEPDAANEPEPVASDPDAAYGVKTRKDGKREVYFGYELHALVRAPDSEPTDDFIPLFEAFELTPAGSDIVAPSLGLIDRSISMGNAITDLLADRHYSYKAEDRWYFQLLQRGVRQHVDRHPNDRGFRDYDGMKLAAGWMHCPSTPDRLGRIESPSPSADRSTKEAFEEAIVERQQYAMRRIARMGASGGGRWQCPALDGRVGCPHREGSVEVAQLNGLPVIV